MTPIRIPPRNEGQTLVVAIMLMMMALILVPYLVMKVQNEGRWTVKESRTTAAYHLAEAGQDRAVWNLVSSTQAWQSAVSGSPAAGYAGDVQYADVAGGLYTITIDSGPTSNDVTVTTKGRDKSTQEVRSIVAVYSGATMQSGLLTQGTFGFNSNFYVYWGQITSYSNITVAKGNTAFTGCTKGTPFNTSVGGVSTTLYYPYKDAASSISPWKTSPTPPTTDTTMNYKAYDKNLPAMPEIDFDYYRVLAQNSKVPVPKNAKGTVQDGGRNAKWAGTGYFDGSGTSLTWQNYTVNCATCVIFNENDDLYIGAGAGSTATGYMLVNALILYKGNLHAHSDGIYAYNLAPPTNAWQQFTAGTFINPNGPGDTAASNEYPGDCGLHTTCATYTVPNSSHTWKNLSYTAPPFDQCENTGLAFHGFLYTYSFNCAAGNNTLSGQIFIGPGGTDIGTGNVTHVIYYDPTVASSVRYVRPPLTRVSWNERLSSWP